VPPLLGLVGTLVVFAGIDLLWQSRRELAFWLVTWFKIFRTSLRQPGTPPLPLELRPKTPERLHILRMLLGMGLLFLVGPLLIVLSFTL
jgi:hypothetical protein